PRCCAPVSPPSPRRAPRPIRYRSRPQAAGWARSTVSRCPPATHRSPRPARPAPHTSLSRAAGSTPWCCPPRPHTPWPATFRSPSWTRPRSIWCCWCARPTRRWRGRSTRRSPICPMRPGWSPRPGYRRAIWSVLQILQPFLLADVHVLALVEHDRGAHPSDGVLEHPLVGLGGLGGLCGLVAVGDAGHRLVARPGLAGVVGELVVGQRAALRLGAGGEQQVRQPGQRGRIV